MSLALGALVCGFFWEMWNYWSYPQWIYHTPGVEFLHVFEMPLLGYGGYIPFALELCALKNFLWPGSPQLQLGRAPGGAAGQGTRIANATGGAFVTGINPGNIVNTIISENSAGEGGGICAGWEGSLGSPTCIAASMMRTSA